MLAKVSTCAVVGLDGYIVEVEVDISPGLPAFTIVGLPDAAVQEARERVRASIRNSGCAFPMRRITVNLAPADVRKAGPSDICPSLWVSWPAPGRYRSYQPPPCSWASYLWMAVCAIPAESYLWSP